MEEVELDDFDQKGDSIEGQEFDEHFLRDREPQNSSASVQWDVKPQIYFALVSFLIVSILGLNNVQDLYGTSTHCTQPTMAFLTVITFGAVGFCAAALGAAFATVEKFNSLTKGAFSSFESAEEVFKHLKPRFEQFGTKFSSIKVPSAIQVTAVILVSFLGTFGLIVLTLVFQSFYHLHRLESVLLFLLLELLFLVFLAALILFRNYFSTEKILIISGIGFIELIVLDISYNLGGFWLVVFLVFAQVVLSLLSILFRNQLRSWVSHREKYLYGTGQGFVIFILTMIPVGVFFSSNNNDSISRVYRGVSYGALANVSFYILLLVAVTSNWMVNCFLLAEILVIALLLVSLCVGTLAVVASSMCKLQTLHTSSTSPRSLDE